MAIDPRPRRNGTADDAAALAFATAASRTSPQAATDAAQGSGADATAHDLALAREQQIRRVLDFEAGWLSHGGAKARAIRAEFGWSTTRYYQVLDGLLETPTAAQHDPMLVRRLLRLREGR